MLQEPLQQTVKQIHVAFDALLDILEVQQDEAAALGLSAQAVIATQIFLEETAREIMSTGDTSLSESSLLEKQKPETKMSSSLLSASSRRVTSTNFHWKRAQVLAIVM